MQITIFYREDVKPTTHANVVKIESGPYFTQLDSAFQATLIPNDRIKEVFIIKEDPKSK